MSKYDDEVDLVNILREPQLVALRANRHKGGWDGESFDYLWAELQEHARMLDAKIGKLEKKPTERKRMAVVDECADIANFAAMIAQKAKE